MKDGYLYNNGWKDPVCITIPQTALAGKIVNVETKLIINS